MIPGTGSSTWWRWHAIPEPHLEWLFEESGLSTEPIDSLISRFPGDPDRLSRWRGTLDADRQRRMEEYCIERMRALGYEPELASSSRSLTSVQRLWAGCRPMAATCWPTRVRSPASRCSGASQRAFVPVAELAGCRQQRPAGATSHPRWSAMTAANVSSEARTSSTEVLGTRKTHSVTPMSMKWASFRVWGAIRRARSRERRGRGRRLRWPRYRGRRRVFQAPPMGIQPSVSRGGG